MKDTKEVPDLSKMFQSQPQQKKGSVNGMNGNGDFDGGNGAREEDDILPDTDIDRERTTTGNWALLCFVIVAISTFLAFRFELFLELNWFPKCSN